MSVVGAWVGSDSNARADAWSLRVVLRLICRPGRVPTRHLPVGRSDLLGACRRGSSLSCPPSRQGGCLPYRLMREKTRTMGTQITGGVDTHLDVHVAAALDEHGGLLGTASFATTTAGYGALVEWFASLGVVVLIGVEGTGSYGAGLTRHLQALGNRGGRGRSTQSAAATPVGQVRHSRRGEARHGLRSRVTRSAKRRLATATSKRSGCCALLATAPNGIAPGR